MSQQATLCDLCRESVATVYVTLIVHGQTTKQRLCEGCARQKGASKEWMQAFEMQVGDFANDSPELPTADDVAKDLLEHIKNGLANQGNEGDEAGTELNGLWQGDDAAGFKDPFADQENISEEELDEFLAEMEAVLDEVISNEILGEAPSDTDFLSSENEDEELDESISEDEEPNPQQLMEQVHQALNLPLELLPAQESAGREALSARCPTCGTTWDRIREDGRTGCAQCYETFEERLLEVMARMQRESRHVGKVPRAGLKRKRRLEHLRTKRDHRLEMLRNRLQEAIAAENYEDAAALRDKIKMVASTIVNAE